MRVGRVPPRKVSQHYEWDATCQGERQKGVQRTPSRGRASPSGHAKYPKTKIPYEEPSGKGTDASNRQRGEDDRWRASPCNHVKTCALWCSPGRQPPAPEPLAYPIPGNACGALTKTNACGALTKSTTDVCNLYDAFKKFRRLAGSK